MVGCMAGDPQDKEPVSEDSLQMTVVDDTTIAGSFDHAGSLIVFHSRSADQKNVELRLEINGAIMEFHVLIGESMTQDGRNNALYAEDQAALMALADAVGNAYPEQVGNTLQGKFLVRHAGYLAWAPAGMTHGVKVTDVAASSEVSDRGSTCWSSDCGSKNNDGTTCLARNRVYRAHYDQGSSGAEWYWNRTVWSGNCLGRCGPGCAAWYSSDNDAMQDCFDHDSCSDHLNGGGGTGPTDSDCGDEFWHADGDYIKTLINYCDH